MLETSLLKIIGRRAANIVRNCSVGGYARGGMRGPLGQFASSHSSGTSFFSDPQRRARFPGSGNESANPLPEPYFLAFPNGVLDFRA